MDDVFSKSYTKLRLKTPVLFNAQQLRTEGIYIEPDLDAEEQLQAREEVRKMEESLSAHGTDFYVSRYKETHIPMCFDSLSGISNGDVKDPILDTNLYPDKHIPLIPYSELEKSFTSITDNGEVKKLIQKVGNGIKPPIHATVWVHYETRWEGQDEPMEQTDRYKPFKFKFFQQDIMTWFDFGVSTMEVSEIAYFLVQPEFAFKKGIVGVIPENSTMLSKVELVKFQESSVPGLLKLPGEDLQAYKYREVMCAVTELKTNAAKFVKRLDWRQAYDVYKKAAHFLEKYLVLDGAEEQEQQKQLFNIHNNLALCALKMTMFQRARFHCHKAFQLPDESHGDRGKAFYRRALSEFELGNDEGALDYSIQAQRYLPYNEDIRDLVNKIKDKLKENALVEKELFRKMMSC